MSIGPNGIRFILNITDFPYTFDYNYYCDITVFALPIKIM